MRLSLTYASASLLVATAVVAIAVFGYGTQAILAAGGGAEVGDCMGTTHSCYGPSHPPISEKTHIVKPDPPPPSAGFHKHVPATLDIIITEQTQDKPVTTYSQMAHHNNQLKKAQQELTNLKPPSPPPSPPADADRGKCVPICTTVGCTHC